MNIDKLKSNEIYVLVLESDLCDGTGEPIVMEQYVRTSSLKEIRAKCDSVFGYGKRRIAKLVFIDEDETC